MDHDAIFLFRNVECSTASKYLSISKEDLEMCDTCLSDGHLSGHLSFRCLRACKATFAFTESGWQPISCAVFIVVIC